jgi:UDP-N-acetylmuramoylalanine--D-glutamate ligase
MNLTGKIGILGGGVEGIALAEYLLEKGYKDVTIFDEKDSPEFKVPGGTKLVSGTDAFQKISGCDVVFRSPGVHPKKLENAGPKITSTTQYFIENCPCRVIGVTGTKGKGTTSTLIYLMLKEGGRDVWLGGNIGQSPLTFLDKLKSDSVVVLELSSFQLQDLTISPHVAVILRTTSEHLDYHKDEKEYRSAKAPIVKYQKADDIVVLNKDYDYWREYAEATPAKKFFVSLAGDIEGDGAHLGGSMIVNCAGPRCEMIGNSSKVALLGKHNLENILPAAVVARYLEVPIPAIQKVIYSFSGLPNRLELVRVVNGVKYYNDSFSTTPETSIAAVYAVDTPVILIAGGSEKNSDYKEWAFELQKNHNLKMVMLMGVTAARMERDLKAAVEKLKGMDVMGEFPVKIRKCADLEEAVTMAAKLAQNDDNVIMSPAAASFDQFKNYKERGEAFRKIVGKL